MFNFLKIKLDILSATVRCRHIQDVTCFNDRIDKLDNLSVFAQTSILLSGCIIKSTICHRAEWFCLKTLTSGSSGGRATNRLYVGQDTEPQVGWN